jgi:hypothetical protein
MAMLQDNLAQVTYKSIPTDWLLYSSLLRQEILLSPVICDTVFSFIMGYSSNIWQTNLQKKKD